MKEALLDTDILSYFFKGDLIVIKKVRDYLKAYPKLNISIISKYEVIGGLEYKNAVKQLNNFDKFLENCEVANLSDRSVRISAKVYGELRKRGITIGTSDLLIAGIAMEKTGD
jgi:tRNA(fMet)-specific endonuclease VapC